MGEGLEVLATPATGLFDEPVEIRVRGAEPGAEVSVGAALTDHVGGGWESRAVFVADARGEVDLAAAAPRSGSYRGADPMGLFWSMEMVSRPAGGLSPHRIEPRVAVAVRAESAGRSAAVEIERVFCDSGVGMLEVEDGDLVGRFFRPAGDGPFPGMLVLMGSSGGFSLHVAALLASRGYAALTLALFGVEGRPADLVETPLEYPKAGIDWLAARDDVRSDAIGVEGSSKGGELALLLGATYPEIRAVVGHSPSGLVHAWRQTETETRSSWTLGGIPVPCARLAFERNDRTRRPLSIRPGYEAVLEDPGTVDRVAIRVERTNGPILMISGDADAMWPSTEFCRVAARRLEKSGFRHRWRHVHYPGAGHAIGIPNLPTVPIPGSLLDHGGTPRDTAHASCDSWRIMLEFLAESLGGPAPG